MFKQIKQQIIAFKLLLLNLKYVSLLRKLFQEFQKKNKINCGITRLILLMKITEKESE